MTMDRVAKLAVKNSAMTIYHGRLCKDVIGFALSLYFMRTFTPTNGQMDTKVSVIGLMKLA